MPFCSNCGSKVEVNAKFCSECGSSVNVAANTDQRKSVYEATIHKCPNCGEMLKSFEGNCSACGYEVRGTTNSNTVKEFAYKLEQVNSVQIKANIIRNFPVPNTKEDILEFMILVVSNIEEDLSNDISNAWRSKLEQAYQKACIVIKSEAEFARINNLYNQALEKIRKEKLRKKAKNIGGVLSELTPVLPNMILVLGWLMSIFILIPLCGINLDNVGFNGTQLLLFFDFIAGTALIPLALKCQSYLPRLMTVLGLTLSIVVIIPQCGKNVNNVGFNSFQLILIVDIICSAVILTKMFKTKIRVSPEQKLKGSSFLVTLISLVFLLITFLISSICASIKENNQKKENDRLRDKEISVQYEGPATGLSMYLPEPESKYGKIRTDDESRFSMDVYKVTMEEFENYVKSCGDKGFNISVTKNDNVFYSYNSEEYSLDVFYYEDDKTMTMYLDAPMKMKEITWPSSDLVKLLPVPDSLVGNIQNNESDLFVVYLDGVTENEFNNYIDRCIKKGFDIDYSRSDVAYRAYDKKGRYINIEMKLFEQMYVKIEIPED